MFEYDPKYKFTEKWFDMVIPIWEDLFSKYDKSKIKNVLEIGCYEGRATIFLCNQVLQKGTKYDIVDTFKGTLEESGMINASKLLENNSNAIYDAFTHNISFHPEINFEVFQNYSQHLLPLLVQENRKYDLIYIDASHRADDTFVDAYYAHKMLNSGGILIFDDFGWKDPNYSHPVSSPELGIRQFFTMYDDYYDLIGQGYQVYALKK